MKNKPISSCLLFFLFLSLGVKSQQEASKWYFGNLCGLDFSTSPPTSLSNGVMNAGEGCATICDNSGNLLFYTDGITVYNKTHTIMANGTGLNGDQSSTQSAVIIKKPGSSTIYYIFTEDALAGPDGLCYSEVNMTLAAGLGSVTVKNYSLFTPSCEKIAAVRHCNGNDLWVISQDANSNYFRTYLVSQAGVSVTPVISIAGASISTAGQAIGQLKISPNGKKLGVALYEPFFVSNSWFEMHDFDASTGIVSNSLALGNFSHSYGCEFSSDGTKFYGSTWDGQLFQWDLCAGSNNAIVASRFTIPTNSVTIGSLQLASDGKIYLSRFGESYLSLINAPNAGGSACNYMDLGLQLTTGTASAGLPNFVNSFFKPKPAPFTNTTVCRTTSFTAAPITTIAIGCSASTYTGVLWNFGDPGSAGANTSALINPSHYFSANGSYTVSLTYASPCASELLTKTLSVISCVGMDELLPDLVAGAIYPNPGAHVLYVKTGEPTTVQVYDNTGKLVLETFLPDGTEPADISELNTGIYAVKIITKTNTITTRLIKSD